LWENILTHKSRHLWEKKEVFDAGLEKLQVLLKKPAGTLNAGLITGFSGKTGFL
jgi:hypothetical protein